MLGLNYLHSNEIIHGDLNINNIVFDNNKEIASFDVFIINVGFGSKNKSIKSDNIQCRSPELLLKRKFDFQTDVWSLGCIVYQLLCGYAPFEGANLKETKIGICVSDISFN